MKVFKGLPAGEVILAYQPEHSAMIVAPQHVVKHRTFRWSGLTPGQGVGQCGCFLVRCGHQNQSHNCVVWSGHLQGLTQQHQVSDVHKALMFRPSAYMLGQRICRRLTL